MELRPGLDSSHATARRSHLWLANDDVLLSWVRQGSDAAFTELYQRHYPDSLRYAARLNRQCSADQAADDVAAEAMRKVITALRHGNGPTIGFRQYLFTAVRSVTVTRLRRASTAVDELPGGDMPAADEGLDSVIMASAFASLPARWRRVLWMAHVDGATPTQIAPALGMSPNSVAALAVRARDALRIAYVRAHLPQSDAPDCQVALDALARRAIAALASTKQAMLTDHLQSCADCRSAAAVLGSEGAEWSMLRSRVRGHTQPRGESEAAVAGAA